MNYIKPLILILTTSLLLTWYSQKAFTPISDGDWGFGLPFAFIHSKGTPLIDTVRIYPSNDSEFKPTEFTANIAFYAILMFAFHYLIFSLSKKWNLQVKLAVFIYGLSTVAFVYFAYIEWSVRYTAPPNYIPTLNDFIYLYLLTLLATTCLYLATSFIIKLAANKN